MIFSKVRKYIESNIASVDSTYKRIDSAFSVDTAESLADKSYFISYSVDAGDTYTGVQKDYINATVIFYFKQFKKGVMKFDYAMDAVNEVRTKLCSITSIAGFSGTDQNDLQSCTFVSQSGESLDDNNKVILVTLTLQLSVFQSIC